jgi:hypothetical protein
MRLFAALVQNGAGRYSSRITNLSVCFFDTVAGEGLVQTDPVYNVVG